MSSSGIEEPSPAPARPSGNPLMPFLVLAVFAGLGAWVYHATGDTLDKLQAEGRTVTGRVTEVTTKRSTVRSGSRLSYFVHFDYTVDGRRLSTSEEASERRALTYRRGDPIAVTYLPSDPRRTCTSMAEARARASGFKQQGVYTVGLAAVLFAGVVGWRHLRGQPG